ncbi:hypothetical protein [Microlunatus sp. Y2014]|uniref:hypothetical protein n=1 Tax=Microlunatus sp. Y2014 TaxID=3418488 RepID=UPI003DA76A77
MITTTTSATSGHWTLADDATDADPTLGLTLTFEGAPGITDRAAWFANPGLAYLALRGLKLEDLAEWVSSR